MSEGAPSGTAATTPNNSKPNPEEATASTLTPPASEVATSDTENPSASELLSRARAFLQLPQIRNQNLAAKRAFLAEKGLSQSDIDSLLHELSPDAPTIPPRTYPLPPPSSLPSLLLGLTRLFSWIAGGSAGLIFIYYRFLLPRITQTSIARHTLKAHHLSLLRRLTTTASSLSQMQGENFAVLPRPEPYKEPASFAECKSIAEALMLLPQENPNYRELPAITLLRCGISDFSKGKNDQESRPNTQDLFRYLEGQIPWLVSEDGLKFEHELWMTLSNCPLFSGETKEPPTAVNTEISQPVTIWTFTPAVPPEPSPLEASLELLLKSLPRKPKGTTSPFQHTLQTLTDFTGYISTQVYHSYRQPASSVLAGTGSPAPIEEDLKREIRALKGLVLNRRTFMPIPSASMLSRQQSAS